ncbi:hypothetical protein [Slackia piriformis]|uniref:hypothetical protein n=1 Tax=Slackia piriformis TaxID=626934 RepID=UPI0039F4B981
MADIIKIGDNEFPVAVTAFTPIIYNGEFRYMKENGHTRAKDINDGLSEIMDGIETNEVPPFLSMAQFFWAFCKTADKNVSGFNVWLGTLPAQAFDMSADESWSRKVWELIQANYFRSATQVASEAAENAAAGAAAGA